MEKTQKTSSPSLKLPRVSLDHDDFTPRRRTKKAKVHHRPSSGSTHTRITPPQPETPRAATAAAAAEREDEAPSTDDAPVTLKDVVSHVMVHGESSEYMEDLLEKDYSEEEMIDFVIIHGGVGSLQALLKQYPNNFSLQVAGWKLMTAALQLDELKNCWKSMMRAKLLDSLVESMKNCQDGPLLSILLRFTTFVLTHFPNGIRDFASTTDAVSTLLGTLTRYDNAFRSNLCAACYILELLLTKQLRGYIVEAGGRTAVARLLDEQKDDAELQKSASKLMAKLLIV